MITSGAASDAAWPLVVIGGLVLMMVMLRWAFSPGKRSLVQRRPRSGAPDSYGLLTPVASPPTYIEGEQQRRVLEDAGIRATLARTTEGPRLLVFPEHASVARALLAAGPKPPGTPPTRG